MSAARNLTDADVEAIADALERRFRLHMRHRTGSPPAFAVSVSDREHTGPCVYVLLLASAVVYVGKTNAGFASRSADHFLHKRFDTIVTLDLEFDEHDDVDGWLFALEEAAARVLRPAENVGAFRGQPNRVGAWMPFVEDLAERIRLACERSPAPRYVPRPAVNLHEAIGR